MVAALRRLLFPRSCSCPNTGGVPILPQVRTHSDPDLLLDILVCLKLETSVEQPLQEIFRRRGIPPATTTTDRKRKAKSEDRPIRLQTPATQDAQRTSRQSGEAKCQPPTPRKFYSRAEERHRARRPRHGADTATERALTKAQQMESIIRFTAL